MLPIGVVVSGRPGARGLNLALKQLMDGPFKDTDVKVALRDKDGVAKTELLAELVARAHDRVVSGEGDP